MTSEQIIDALVLLRHQPCDLHSYRQALLALCKLAQAEVCLAVTLDTQQVALALSDHFND